METKILTITISKHDIIYPYGNPREKEETMNKENLTAAFANAVKDMQATHFEGTYHWYLSTDDKGNDWAIVMSYMDYDDDGNESLYAKLAYQPSNSIMQCDYDIDWLMPYDEETGELYDTELSV